VRSVAPARATVAVDVRPVRDARRSATVRAARARPLALLLLVPLAYLAAAHLARALAVVLPPWEQMYGESIIYDQAQRLLRGEPLYMPYDDRPPYSVAAYTPLYYWLAAALQALFGPGFLPGRIVSFIAALVAAMLVGYVASQRTGDRWAWPFGAVIFLALGMPGAYPLNELPAPYPTWLGMAYPFFPWMALYKEDVLAAALSIGSVALLAGPRWRSVAGLAGLLAALAFLTKQTAIAPAAACLVWHWFQDRRAAVAFALCAGLPVAAAAATLELTTGAFLANTVYANANPFALEALLLNLKMLALFQIGPLLLAALWLFAPRAGRTRLDSLLALYLLGTALPLVGLGKVGSNHNHWLEFAVATSVVATVALWAVAETRWRALLAALLLALHAAALVPLVNVTALKGLWEQRSLAAVEPDAGRAAAFQQLVERVRAEPRDVVANPLDVIVLAGRPVLLEPYLFSIFHSQGLWSPDPIVGWLCTRRVGLIVTDHPLEQFNPSYHGYTHWPAPVYGAMLEAFARESHVGGRYVYVPRAVPVPGPICDRHGG
jgi:hypothetical protein